MPRRSESKKTKLEAYFAKRKPERIDETVWSELVVHLAPVSSSYLRELLKSAGLPLDPLIEGVRQDSLEEAERTLVALSCMYSESSGERRARVRAAVIESKDRLRWSLKRDSDDSERRALKQEILLWTMTWLENPLVFESWLAIRKHVVR
jgi:hypothetical protein